MVNRKYLNHPMRKCKRQWMRWNTHRILVAPSQGCKNEIRHHTERMRSHSFVFSDIRPCLRRDAVYNLDWSRLPQMDPQIWQIVLADSRDGTFINRIRLQRSPQNWHKTSGRWRLLPFMNHRGRPKASLWRHTCPCFRRAEKWRAERLINNHPQQRRGPASSVRRKATWRTTHEEGTSDWTAAVWRLSNCSTPRETTKHRILYW